MSIPVLDCLRENFPKAKIVGIAKRNQQGILRDGPWLHDFIDCKDKSWNGFREMVRQIRDLDPDMAIVLPNSVRSLASIRLGGVKRIYGYRRNLRGVFVRGPKPSRSMGKITAIPMQEYYLEICRWMGLEPPIVSRPRLFIGDVLQRQGDELLQKYGIQSRDRIIGMNPGASFGSSKCWLPEYFARTAEMFLQEMNTKILLFSGPGEQGITAAIKAQARAPVIDTGPDNIDLEKLKPLIKRCDLLISNDTGPRHYAVALDVPVVVIMGPTDPGYTSANLEKTVVLRKELGCSPCHKKICPTDHRCMKEITPLMVFEAGKKLLQGNGGNADH
jgi:heptosyltransferase-2